MKNTELEILRDENKSLAQELKQKQFELNMLYDISRSISYTLDYDDFLKLIMDSLHKIVDYDICASLLIPDGGKKAKMIIRVAHTVGSDIIAQTKARVINSLSMLTQDIISEQNVSCEFINLEHKDRVSLNSPIKSSFDVPLFAHNRIAGILNVASTKEVVYSDDETKLLYSLAQQASAAIERLQAVLSAEKSKMQIMVEGMSEGVIMFDEREKLVIFNASARQMLNNKIELLGEVNQVKVQDKTPLLRDIILERPFPRVIQSVGMKVEDETGRFIGIIFLLRDVTAEREIDKMKSDFVSVVSHELRTPLAAMKGAVDNLNDGICGEMNSMQRDCVVLTKRNIDRLGRLISDLLDVSRIESGKIKVNKAPADINMLISEVLGFFAESARLKKISLTDRSDKLPRINVDADKITQVLTNLIGNSLKFTPENGEISVEAFACGNMIQVNVVDNGIGIPQQDLQKVFDKFYQVESSPQGLQAKGTGLGLPICKGIIEKHDGKIWAESGLVKGSKFCFTLPLN